MTDTREQEKRFVDALEDFAIGCHNAYTKYDEGESFNEARTVVLSAFRKAVRDAKRWQDFAWHLASCRECGETSWESCFEGKTLHDAASGTADSTAEPAS